MGMNLLTTTLLMASPAPAQMQGPVLIPAVRTLRVEAKNIVIENCGNGEYAIHLASDEAIRDVRELERGENCATYDSLEDFIKAH